MNRVQDLIIKALNTADNNELRQQAEKTIFGLLAENPAEFFLTCAHIVADAGKVEKIRQSAASVMKALLSKRTDNNDYFWDLVSPGFRPQIKDILLSNLISHNLLVMRAGANAIAQIAAIEISRGEWLEIIVKLAQNSLHEELNIRRASITTLGFICEELKSFRSNLNQATCEQILGSILVSLRESELVEISLIALRDSISFLRGTLENEAYCTQVLEQIFPFLSTDYKNKVYEILFEFGRYCYHLLGNYIPLIAQATVQHIDQRSDNSILALEFWDTVGTEFLRRVDEAKERVISEGANIRNLVEEMHELIITPVMASILIITKDDIDFPELRESAVKTLTTLVACCGRHLVDRVTEGVSRVIQSPNPGERQASALLFSCLIDFPDRVYIQHCFVNGFRHLYSLINDTQNIVRRNTLNGFVTLSECFPNVFLKNPGIFEIFDHMIKLSVTSDEAIQVLALSILINVTDNLKECPDCQVVKQPDKILQELVDEFTKNLHHNSNKQSNEKIIGIIMNIVMATNKRKVIEMLLDHLINLYIQFSNVKIRDQEIIMAQILAIVHTSVLALVKFPVDIGLKRKVYELLDLHINNYGVETEGIHLIGALALCFKRQFLNEQFDKYWSVVMQGLEMIEQKLIFRGALTCIQDIARNNENRISGKLSQVFGRLIQYMHNSIERELKTEILRCFGDLTLGLKSYTEGYVDNLLKICDDCFTAVYKFSQIQTERQYAEELKQALVEMYHCVVFALNEQNGSINKKLANHFQSICLFVVNTCDIKQNPTVDYLKNCLGLVFDAALFYSRAKDYKQVVNQIINSRQINILIENLRKHKEKPGVLDVLIFIQDKLKSQRR